MNPYFSKFHMHKTQRYQFKTHYSEFQFPFPMFCLSKTRGRNYNYNYNFKCEFHKTLSETLDFKTLRFQMKYVSWIPISKRFQFQRDFNYKRDFNFQEVSISRRFQLQEISNSKWLHVSISKDFNRFHVSITNFSDMHSFLVWHKLWSYDYMRLVSCYHISPHFYHNY